MPPASPMRSMREWLADLKADCLSAPSEIWAVAGGLHLRSEILDVIAQIEAELEQIESLRVQAAMRDLRAHLPPSLTLSPKEEHRLLTFVASAIEDLPTATWQELLWRFAFFGAKPRARGRKARWLGHGSKALVDAVEAILEVDGLRRDRKKGLRHAVNSLREIFPQTYGKISEGTLCRRYYEAVGGGDLSVGSASAEKSTE